MIDEILWRAKILKGEYNRKFVHISVGSFAAFWPWLLSWRQIQALCLILLAGRVINQLHTFVHDKAGIKRRTYGEYFFPVGIGLCTLLTTNKLFFALAVLNMAVADGLAAVIGQFAGARWRYQVFGYTKTIIGTMTFWLATLSILGIGLLLASDAINFADYGLLLLLLPPALTVLENFSLFGLDDITVPVVTLAVLQLV
ncbi:TPA: hypothetical protein DIS56_00970 [Candidatus Saccharibacteria bacterium]|nr:hypothetical protein [Candidatus Saccharibacteria bacterium]